MSTSLKQSNGGSTVYTTAKRDCRNIYTWQLPKLKVVPIAPSIPASTTTTSTPSRTSFSTASSEPMTAESSFQTSPDSLAPFEFADFDQLPPLQLPTSTSDSQPTSPPPPETLNGVRPPGLIRRFSRGASQRLRGRSSMSNMKSRDHNAGSVVRRRSDSRSMADGTYDISDLELEDVVNEADEPLDAQSPHTGESGWPNQRVTPRNLSRRASEKDVSKVAITIPMPGRFIKVTKRKKKEVRIELDVPSGKISWSHSASTARKQLYLDDIREIRAGDTAKNFLAEFSLSDDILCKWFTVVYYDPDKANGRAIKFLHLIADENDIRNQWVAALLHVMRTRDNLMSAMAVNDERQWRNLWHREMIRRFGTKEHAEDERTLDFTNIKSICRNLSINKSDRLLRAQFVAVAGGKSDASLNQEQYLEFFRLLTERRDLRRIYDSAIETSPAGTMTYTQFQAFADTHQMAHASANPEQWLSIYSKFAGKRRGQVPGTKPSEDALVASINFESFRDFLWSGFNAPLKPAVPQPLLKRPLNEYFISSSHNTYLEGRQFRGESSTEMYIEALKRGCRCIEIDCDNGSDGKPCVTHVMTATSRVPFIDCIRVINQYAFVASEYPLIISLEVHCNPEQQQTMAEIMIEQFGSQLVRRPLIPGDYSLPTPEELRRRILIKVKKPMEEDLMLPLTTTKSFGPVSETTSFSHRRQRSLSAPNPGATAQYLSRPSPLAHTISPTTSAVEAITLVNTNPNENNAGTRSSASSLPTSDDSDIDLGPGVLPKKSKSKSNIVKELGELGVYTRGVKFSDWKSHDSRSPNHVYSFNEKTFHARCKPSEGKTFLERHNTKCLMRVYPRGSRVYSSNFDPLQFWRRGVQMVATNWQTYDLGTQINDAMFAAGTDLTGYVLKPEEIRRFHSSDSGSIQKRKLERKVVSFSVDIISAQYLEAPSDMRQDAAMNPYVELEVYCAEDKDKDEEVATGEGGVDALARNDKANIGSFVRKRTRIVEGNGFDPIFDEAEKDTIKSKVITKYPSLVFLRWTVWNSPDGRNLSSNKPPVATFTAKLDSLEQGYRHLPLYNKRGELLHSKLFCRIQKHPLGTLVSPTPTEDFGVERARASDETARTGKDFLRRLLSRTPSERRKISCEGENAAVSRTASTERLLNNG